MKQAMYHKVLEDKRIQCLICPSNCILSEGVMSPCNARKVINGELISLWYGKPCAVHVDPVEKKPLYHFYPHHQTLSVAALGCNLHCTNCQNFTISQNLGAEKSVLHFSPQDIIDKALSLGLQSISLTYTDPVAWYEYALDIAKLANENGIKVIFVSAGYINPQPLKEIAPYLSAANIDLKVFDNAIYKKICKVQLEPILETLLYLKNQNIWLEITNLLIPGINNVDKQIARLCDWLVQNDFQNVPLHFSRFIPAYLMAGAPPTAIENLVLAKQIANERGIKYVYIGNTKQNEFTTTHCPKCETPLIERYGYKVILNDFENGCCSKCGCHILGFWD